MCCVSDAHCSLYTCNINVPVLSIVPPTITCYCNVTLPYQTNWLMSWAAIWKWGNDHHQPENECAPNFSKGQLTTTNHQPSLTTTATTATTTATTTTTQNRCKCLQHQLARKRNVCQCQIFVALGISSVK